VLTFGPLQVTGEQSRKPTEYDLHDMVKRDTANANAPAAAWCEVFWCGVPVGRFERVDWVVLDKAEPPYSTYWFISTSRQTQIASRDKDTVLQRVTQILQELMPPPGVLHS
jgi:hypothetical protein